MLVVWMLLVINLFKESKSKRAKRSTQQELNHLSRQAKIEAQERMAKAVEKEYTALHKSLQAEAESIQKDFKKSIHEVTSKNLKDFNDTLAQINTSMQQQAKILAEASQKQAESTQKQINDETAKIKAKVISEVDNNISEIMVSYLAEVAGDLDYYQQKDYLYNSIEANKAAIKKDIENAV
jgi:hypothetical protein